MSGIYKEDIWTVAEAEVNGRPMIVRARDSFPSIPDRAIYENLVIISCKYDAHESGMPEHNDTQKMMLFEEAIENGIELRGIGVQAGCITGNGGKEWRYFTYDTNEFMGKLKQCIAGQPVLPIEVKNFKDPEWSALSELLHDA